MILPLQVQTLCVAIYMSDWLANLTHIARNKSHFTDYISEPNEIQGIAPGSPLKTIGEAQ